MPDNPRKPSWGSGDARESGHDAQALRMAADKPEAETSLIKATQNAIDEAPFGPNEQAIAALTILLDYWRRHDPCDIVISDQGPFCDRHNCRKGGCPIDIFEAKHGLQ